MKKLNIKEVMLFPSCSEICWRLDFKDTRTTKEKIVDTLMEKELENRQETDTSSFPNGCFDEMIYLIKEAKKQDISPKDIELEYIDNLGGGGNLDYVEKCFDIALKYCEGKITKKQAETKDEKLWHCDEVE